MAKSQIIPPPSSSTTTKPPLILTLLSYIPWYIYLLGLIYIYLKYGREKKKKVGRSARKRAGKPPLPIPSRPQQQQQQQQQPVMRQHSTPGLTRRSSFHRQASGGGNGIGTPLRRGYGSMRGLNRVASSGLGGAQISGIGSGSRDTGIGRWNHVGAGNDDAPLSPPLRYASPSRASPQQPSSNFPLPRSSSYLGPTGFPLPASPSFSPALPRKRFTEVAPPPVGSGSRKRGFVEEDFSRFGMSKRSRRGVESDTEEMELDELREVNDPGFRSRGVKRKEEEEEEEEDEDDDEEEGEEGDRHSTRKKEKKRSRKISPESHRIAPSTSASPRKRSRTKGSDDSSSMDGGDSKKKRSRVGRRTKPSSKRELEVSSDEEDDDDREGEGEGERVGGARNADSEFGSDEEDTDIATVEEEEKQREKKGSKRLRSKAGRVDTDDYDMMYDVRPTALSPPLQSTSTSAPPPSTKKRNLPTPKNRQSLAKLVQQKRMPISSPAKGTVGTKVGEEWTDLEGERWKIGEDGEKRRMCEVREMRYKYKMPKDSRHPDRNVMHEVLAEKWLTMEEYDRAVADRKLSWQHPVVEVKAEDKSEMEVDQGSSAQEPPEDRSGIFYTRGIGTPLRTHSNISRSVSSNSLTRSSSTGGTTSSPKLSALANGRMRLPSGVGANQSPRSWSHGRAMRLQGDERRAKEEREKRRIKAMLEEEKVRPKAKEEVPPLVPTAKDTPVTASGSGSALPSINFGPPSTSTSKPPAETKPAPPSFFTPKPAADKPAPILPSFTPSVTAAPASAAAKKPDFFAPPPTSTSAAPKAPFAFGQIPTEPKPASAAAPEKAETKLPSLSFGSSGTTSTPAAPALVPFAFGAPPAATTPATEVKSSAPFSFGASKPATASAPPAASPFNFGAQTPAATPTATAAAPPSSTAPKVPSFFGAAPTTEASKSPFSLGAPTTSPAVQPEKAIPPPFSFGTPAAPPAAQPATAPPFSFGVPTAAPASAAASPFSFGGQGAATAPTAFGNAPASAAPAMNFGGPAAGAAASPFAFGGQATNPNPNPFSAPAPAAAPGAPIFSFGPGAPTTGTTGGQRSVRRLPVDNPEHQLRAIIKSITEPASAKEILANVDKYFSPDSVIVHPMLNSPPKAGIEGVKAAYRMLRVLTEQNRITFHAVGFDKVMTRKGLQHQTALVDLTENLKLRFLPLPDSVNPHFTPRFLVRVDLRKNETDGLWYIVKQEDNLPTDFGSTGLFIFPGLTAVSNFAKWMCGVGTLVTASAFSKLNIMG